VTVRLLAFLVALSFPAALVPLAKVSAADATMACCVGKKEEESHCHASAKAKKAAKHEHTSDPAKPAFKSALKAPCSDCCACTIANQQQRRERGAAQPVVRHTSPLALLSHPATGTTAYSSTDLWAQISPRGPPTFLL
jgi:hypothetical protein